MSASAFPSGVSGIDAWLARLAAVRPQPLWRTVLIGLAWSAASLLLRAALSGLYSGSGIAGSTILFPGVVLAALMAGRTAGFVATVASLLGTWAIAGPDAMGVGITSLTGRVATFNFLAVGGFVTVVAASLRKSLARLGEAIAVLETTQDEVRRNEAELAAMVDQASAGIARVDLSGAVVSSNARFAELLGYTPDAVIGIRTRDVTHPDDVQATLHLLDRIREGQGDGDQVEKRYIRPDGAVVWGLTSLRALRDEDGAQSGYIAVIVDITDAKAAESALRESEMRFRLMADTAPSPVWLTNAEGEVEFVNKALVDFYGKPGETFMGHAWKASIHPDDIADVNATQAEARARFLPYGFECRFMRHDGAWRWMRVSVNPRFDGEGAFQGYVGLSFDVTAQREALDALAQQERRQRFLLELSDGVRDLNDPDDVIDHAQSVLGRMLNVSRVGFGEMDVEAGVYHMRRDWTERVSSIVGTTRIESFGQAVSESLLSGVTVAVDDTATDLRTADNAADYLAIDIGAFVVVPLFRAGLLRGFINVHSASPRTWTLAEIKLVEDVADRAWSEVERTRAQAEVLESEARFRDIADTAPVLIWVTSQDRTRAFVNQAYVEYMGGDYETVRLADWRTYIHPDDQDRVVQESIAGEATRQPFALEARYKNRDGEYRWLKSFSRPRFGPAGDIIGFVGVAFDVTDARRVEQDLKRINELLEERVGDALAEKAKAEADLMHAQRMEAVGRLTGGVAHDFNNLLTVVIGALDLILKSPEDAARRQKLGEAALSAARRGERLTHQLLAFSRRQALRPEAVDINALIRESDPLLRRAVGEAVAYKLKLRRGGARVIVDPAQFEAALLNLIVNARDAVAEGGRAEGATISVQTQACEVAPGEVLDLPPGDYICVTVSDTGAGMDAVTMRRVFEPFFTTKAVGKGTGLGLSQVYGFARQSGGGVKITSTVGEGTEIRVYLPPAPVEEEAVEAPRRAPGAMKAGQTVLLVEDDAGVAAIAMDLLKGMGLEVAAAETGPQALALLDQRRFDIMLSDIVMPGGMTGIDLARTSADRWPEMSILLTSGYAGDDVDLALADAPWPFLRKPYSAEELREALADLLITTPAAGQR
ncbi:PAS domain S-box protein [Brevundimonas sp. NIBR11]|uniref:PAS domain S-box protein n=1 Tax=Brevundimonas sp. NIBR11 TaxID=3015999 RepID=UPI0022F0BCF0|nr:PAS domain S-box protein [Brevundimonas sp. NIBR11]WGM30035.1 Sensor histidine kinase RcsC [Brevundimonas sp. NIBR11]